MANDKGGVGATGQAGAAAVLGSRPTEQKPSNRFLTVWPLEGIEIIPTERKMYENEKTHIKSKTVAIVKLELLGKTGAFQHGKIDKVQKPGEKSPKSVFKFLSQQYESSISTDSEAARAELDEYRRMVARAYVQFVKENPDQAVRSSVDLGVEIEGDESL